MNDKTKPVVIGLLIVAVIAASAVFIHGRMGPSAEEQTVIVKPDNPDAAPHQAAGSAVTGSAN